MLMKPKRELHGSARFANRMEITKHGLLKKKFTGDEEPDLLIGKYGNDYLRWSGNEFFIFSCTYPVRKRRRYCDSKLSSLPGQHGCI